MVLQYWHTTIWNSLGPVLSMKEEIKVIFLWAGTSSLMLFWYLFGPVLATGEGIKLIPFWAHTDHDIVVRILYCSTNHYIIALVIFHKYVHTFVQIFSFQCLCTVISAKYGILCFSRKPTYRKCDTLYAFSSRKMCNMSNIFICICY